MIKKTKSSTKTFKHAHTHTHIDKTNKNKKKVKYWKLIRKKNLKNPQITSKPSWKKTRSKRNGKIEIFDLTQMFCLLVETKNFIDFFSVFLSTRIIVFFFWWLRPFQVQPKYADNYCRNKNRLSANYRIEEYEKQEQKQKKRKLNLPMMIRMGKTTIKQNET